MADMVQYFTDQSGCWVGFCAGVDDLEEPIAGLVVVAEQEIGLAASVADGLRTRLADAFFVSPETFFQFFFFNEIHGLLKGVPAQGVGEPVERDTMQELHFIAGGGKYFFDVIRPFVFFEPKAKI